MRLSDLLQSRVVDADGVAVGQVKDVLVTQEGPQVGGHDALLAVDGLVVGGYHATRLGFERGGAQGPWLIAALFRRLERKARFVPWDAVASCEGSTLRLSARRQDLDSPPII